MDINSINQQTLTQEEIRELLEIKARQSDWRNKLKKSDGIHYDISPENYLTYFDCSPETKGKLRFNSLTQMAMFGDHPITDGEMNTIYTYTISFFNNKSNKGWFDAALSRYFNEHQYDPLQDYFNELSQWDGIPRMETVFIDWLGAEDTKLNREMTRKWFLAAVKRAFIPGCQFDNMIILQCAEGGGGKTTLIKRLGRCFDNNNDHFYAELYGNDIEDEKQSAEKLKGAHIVCFDELEGISKKDVNNYKSFLSKTAEKTRPAYGRYVTVFNRHCVFIGSTNDNGFLKDYSGSTERRFWVIPITRQAKDNIVYDGFTKEIVDQIWAEAYTEYINNPRETLDISKDNYDELGEIQKNFKSYNNDVDTEYFKEIMERKFILNERGEFATMQDFLNQMNNVNGETGFENKKYIHTIPAKFIKAWADEHKYQWKGAKYIAAAMGCYHKQAKYWGKPQWCFVRYGTPDFRTTDIKTFDVSTLIISGSELF